MHLVIVAARCARRRSPIALLSRGRERCHQHVRKTQCIKVAKRSKNAAGATAHVPMRSFTFHLTCWVRAQFQRRIPSLARQKQNKHLIAPKKINILLFWLFDFVVEKKLITLDKK
jgi:hypothetical protein